MCIRDSNSIAESSEGAGLSDTITDFEGSVDVIDISAVDANQNTAANDDFVIVANFSGTAGEMTIGGGVILGDTDGDGDGDLVINYAGDTPTGDDILGAS